MKLHSIEIIEERQVSANFPDGCASPVQLHFQTDEGEQPVTGVLPGDDFHRSGSTLEFLVQAFDDIGGSERNPLIFRKLQVGQAGFQRVSETFDG